MINKQNLKEKRLEVLNDTISYFKTSTRCINSRGRCTYSPTEESKGCAIGRLITDKNICTELDFKNQPIGADSAFNILPIEIKELGQDFLRNLQLLHDLPYYWLESGLSEEGLNKVNHLKLEYDLN